jgi:hypothetical protein
MRLSCRKARQCETLVEGRISMRLSCRKARQYETLVERHIIEARSDLLGVDWTISQLVGTMSPSSVPPIGTGNTPLWHLPLE